MTARSRTDSGGATVLVVAMAGVLLFVMTGLASAGGLVVAQRRAQAAADLAALAAAGRPEESCAAALSVAAASDARLDSCVAEGRQVRVVLSVAGPAVPWREVRVTAEARAGPS